MHFCCLLLGEEVELVGFQQCFVFSARLLFGGLLIITVLSFSGCVCVYFVSRCVCCLNGGREGGITCRVLSSLPLAVAVVASTRPHGNIFKASGGELPAKRRWRASTSLSLYFGSSVSDRSPPISLLYAATASARSNMTPGERRTDRTHCLAPL